MSRKICFVWVWICWLALPEVALAITGNSCSVTINGTVGTPISMFTACSTISVFTNPNINFVSGTPMPPGMLISKSSSSGGNATWQVSGTPTAAGTGSAVYSFTDSNSGAVTMSISYSILGPVVPAAAFAAGTAGRPYPAVTATASGGTGSGYSFQVGSGNLPTGLSLSSTGLLSGTATAAGTFNFSIQATDSGANAGSTSFTIVINPAVSMSSTASLSRTVGQSFGSVFSASGGTVPVVYSLTAGSLPAGATLNAASGGISGTANTMGSGSFTITAIDANGSSSSTQVAYQIAPLPVIALATPGGMVGVAYSQPVVFTGAISSSTLSTGALPAGLALNGGGTLVSGTPTIAGTFSFSLAGSDSNGISAVANFTITVNASLAITTASLPNPTLATSYSATIAATGGAAPIAFAVTGGNLPAGLTLSQSGVLSGVPTAPGSATFTVAASDSQSSQVTRSFTLVVSASLIQISTSTLPAAIQGSTYSATIQANGGAGLLTYAVTVGGLPPGLALSTGGGLSGTPTTPGTYSFTVSVTDGFGGSASVQLSMQVSAPPIVFSTTSLPAAQVGSFYTASIVATGGAGPLTFAVQSGSLPPGLQLASGGQVSGSATVPGVYSFLVLASDSLSNSSSRTLSIAVTSPISITTSSSLNPTTVGAPVNFSFAANGGTAPLTWTVNGALPPGLALVNGKLVGTALLEGTYSFGIQVSDANGASAAAQFTQLVNPALAIGNPNVGGPYSRNGSMSVNLIPVGGTAPFEWSVALGTLPAGVTLNRETGRLAGAFSNLGSFVFSIRLKDQAGASIIRPFTITITNGPQFASATLPQATTNHPYRIELEVYSTLPVVDWQVATPAATFPPGLRLVGPEIVGTPTRQGAFEFELNVRDQGGSSAVERFTLLINPPLELLEQNTPSQVPLGNPHSWFVPRRGGTAPYRFQLLNGRLPNGLTLHGATGEVSGRAVESGSFSFTIGVTDANQATANRLYALTSGQGFSILSEGLPRSLMISRDVKIPIQTRGGIGPIRIQLNQEALPAGLALRDGVVIGKPSSAGVFNIELSARDSSGAVAVLRWSFQVVDGIEVQPRSLSFTQISGTLLSIPQTLKWVTAPFVGQVRISATTPWLRTSTTSADAPGSVDVWVEPTLLPEGISTAELVLESGTATTRIPVQVEQLRSDPANWWIEATSAQGGGWIALIKAESTRMPFAASLDTVGSSLYSLSETSGETIASEAFLLWLEPKQSGSARSEAVLQVRNLISTEEQRIEFPNPSPGQFELSASYIALRGQLGASRSTRSSLIVRSNSAKLIQVAGLSTAPWLLVTTQTGSSSRQQILTFQADLNALPLGTHEAIVDLYNQDGMKFDSILVQLEIRSSAPPVEVSTNSLTLDRGNPVRSVRLFNPGKDPVGYLAVTKSSALQLKNGEGWIEPGAEVSVTVSASSDKFNSWSRHRVHIAIGGARLELLEVDLAVDGSRGGCPSSSPVLSMLSPGAAFVGTADDPIEFKVTVRNTCGEIIPGSVTAIRIPGYGPVPLYLGPDGVWFGTWTPTETVGNLQIEAIWLDRVQRRSVNRSFNASVQP